MKSKLSPNRARTASRNSRHAQHHLLRVRLMSYDIHIVRTDSWLDSAENPITKSQLDELIASDPQLTWSTDDWVDMSDDDGQVTRHFFIIWKMSKRD